MTKKEAIKEITDWLKKQNLKNKKFFSIPIQKFVYFTNSGYKHTISRNYKYSEIEIMLTKNIASILPNSFYMGFVKNTDKTKKEVKGVHKYYDMVQYKGELFEVWMKVKETTEKTYFYDHGIIKKL